MRQISKKKKKKSKTQKTKKITYIKLNIFVKRYFFIYLLNILIDESLQIIFLNIKFKNPIYKKIKIRV